MSPSDKDCKEIDRSPRPTLLPKAAESEKAFYQIGPSVHCGFCKTRKCFFLCSCLLCVISASINGSLLRLKEPKLPVSSCVLFAPVVTFASVFACILLDHKPAAVIKRYKITNLQKNWQRARLCDPGSPQQHRPRAPQAAILLATKTTSTPSSARDQSSTLPSPRPICFRRFPQRHTPPHQMPLA